MPYRTNQISSEKKNVLKNIFSLGTLQTIDYLVPILIIPYLLRVIGIDNFGILAFSSALVAYFSLFTEYGFNLSATRLVSLNRNDQQKLSEIFSAVLLIKLLLFLIGLILLIVLVSTIDKFNDNREIIYLTFSLVLGQALFPIWLFQGLEKMSYITLISSSSKILFTSLIFVFVQTPEDTWLVPLLISAGFLFSGVIGVFIAIKSFSVRFRWCEIEVIKHYLKDGKHAFVSTSGAALYRNSNILILGLFTNPTLVGYYAIAEKVILVIQKFQAVFGNALFPYIIKRIQRNEMYFFNFDKKNKIFIASSYVIATLILILTAPSIVELLTGNFNPQVSLLIQVMSIVVFVSGMSYYYGVLGLMAMNHKKYFSESVLITGFLNLVICSILIYYFSDFGASMALIISESILLILIITRIRKIKSLQIESSHNN